MGKLIISRRGQTSQTTHVKSRTRLIKLVKIRLIFTVEVLWTTVRFFRDVYLARGDLCEQCVCQGGGTMAATLWSCHRHITHNDLHTSDLIDLMGSLSLLSHIDNHNVYLFID